MLEFINEAVFQYEALKQSGLINQSSEFFIIFRTSMVFIAIILTYLVLIGAYSGFSHSPSLVWNYTCNVLDKIMLNTRRLLVILCFLGLMILVAQLISGDIDRNEFLYMNSFLILFSAICFLTPYVSLYAPNMVVRLVVHLLKKRNKINP